MHVTNIIMVRHNNVMSLRVTGLGVFDTWFLRVRYGVERTRPVCLLDAANFLTYVVHLLKLQDIQNLSISSKSFNWPILLNLACKTNLKWPVLAHFWPNYCKKLSIFLPNSIKLVGNAKSLIILLHSSTSELGIWEYSFKYNSPTGGA